MLEKPNEKPEQHSARPEAITRRDFLETAAVSAAAGALLVQEGAASEEELSREKGHGKEEDMDHAHAHPDMKALLEREQQHPFHKDPEAWLREHEAEIEAKCFAPTGELIERVPGSGVLENPDAWVARLAQKAKALSDRSGKPVKVVLESHKSCGAAGLAFKGDADPDERAREAQKKMVDGLRAQGIDAEHGGDSAMNDLSVHNALGATIDFTQGRMVEPPLNTFVISTPEDSRVTADTLLAAAISSGDHSYGTLLKQYTIVAFMDRDRRAECEQALQEIDAQSADLRRKGVNVRIIRRDAPPAPVGYSPTVIRVKCIDERVQQPMH